MLLILTGDSGLSKSQLETKKIILPYLAEALELESLAN